MGSSMGVKGWLKAVPRRPSHIKNEACPTSSSEGARRCVHEEPSEICPRGLRVSRKPDDGMWQLAHATFPVSPWRPKVPGSPLLASSSKGPEKRLSKKSFLPSAAARGSSAYLLVGSAGGGGSF